jgi:hypothetical protein
MAADNVLADCRESRTGVVCGDLLDQNVDVIVNPRNRNTPAHPVEQ